MELAGYLAEKTVQHAMRHRKGLVVAWGCECLATHKDVTHLQSSQEEADTKIKFCCKLSMQLQMAQVKSTL